VFRVRTAENVVILVALQWLNRGLAVVTKIVLVRLLFPEDFGTFALAVGLLGFVSTFGNFGLDYAIVQKGPSATERDYDVGMSLRLLIAIVLFAVTFVLANPWAQLFSTPIVSPTTQVLALIYLVTPWSFVPSTRLVADLKFRAISVPNLVAQIANSALSVGLAFAGFRVWSLVLSFVAAQILATLTYVVVQPYRFHLSLDRGTVQSLLGFGRHLVFAALLGFLITNIDNFAIGYFLGSIALGFYAVAYGIGYLPVALFSTPAGAALFPSLAKIEADRTRLRSAYSESLSYAAAAILPTGVGLAVVAPELVIVFFGPQWEPAILPLVVLGANGACRGLLDFSSSLFSAAGTPKEIARLNLYVLLLSVVLLFPLTLGMGIVGTAIAMTIPVFVVFLISIYRSAAVVDARPSDLVRSIRGPILAAESMGVLVFFSKLGLSAIAPSALVIPFTDWAIRTETVVLLLLTPLGVLVYLVLLRIADRDVFEGLFRHGLVGLGRRRSP